MNWVRDACLVAAAGESRAFLKRELEFHNIKARRGRLVIASRITPLLIAVDGGADHLLGLGIEPEILVGDMDSIKTRSLSGQVQTLKLPRKKDVSDFEAALRLCELTGVPSVHVYGAFLSEHARADHELASLLSAAAYVQRTGNRLQFAGSRGRCYLLPEGVKTSLEMPKPRATFSVFALGGPAKGVSVKGALYELSGADLTPGSLGLSNVARLRTVSIHAKKGVLGVIVPSTKHE